ncbi:radical SAM protein [Polyangium mundeleinium]|uniref:Radical SAM protein n=1 Tax=Polyangium mundeleinium TaxID=2995306 RepID=A0ABT5EN79_9BACT|nr:radical SAM protein [Polyangium mundeleinium]MDC0742929.1 radical SAM protein [Polyangium mundeleinium]
MTPRDGTTREGLPAPGRELVERVAAELQRNPFLGSERLCGLTGCSRAELCSAYEVIRSDREIQRSWHGSILRDFFVVAAQLMARASHLERIIQGELVFPLFIEFHAGGACPIHCSFCYNEGTDYYKAQSWRAQMIDEAMLLEIIDEAADNGTVLFYVAGGGEPTTDRRIWRPLARAKQRGMITMLNTMGVHLDRPQVRADILASVDQIRVSLNAATQRSYRLIAQLPTSTMFGTVCDGLRALAEERDREGARLRITCSFVLVRDNWDEIERMAELGHSLGVDDVYVRPAWEGANGPSPRDDAAIAEGVERLKRRIERGEFGRTTINVGTSVETESTTDSAFRAALQDAECIVHRFKIGIDAWGNVHRCSLVAQPGVGRFEHVLGSRRASSSLREIVDAVAARNEWRVEDCVKKNVLCSTFEGYFNAFVTKLKRDALFGVSIAEQPFLSMHEQHRWFADRLDGPSR